MNSSPDAVQAASFGRTGLLDHADRPPELVTGDCREQAGEVLAAGAAGREVRGEAGVASGRVLAAGDKVGVGAQDSHSLGAADVTRVGAQEQVKSLELPHRRSPPGSSRCPSDECPADLTPGVENGLVDGVALQAETGGDGVQGYPVDHDRDEGPPVVRGQLVVHDAAYFGWYAGCLRVLVRVDPEPAGQPFPLPGVERARRVAPVVAAELA